MNNIGPTSTPVEQSIEHLLTDFGPGKTITFKFTGPDVYPESMARENLEQIEDNNKAVTALTVALNFISMVQAKPRCETCGEVNDILTSNGVVAGLYAGLHALSRYSELLVHETKRGLAEGKEADLEQQPHPSMPPPLSNIP